MRSGRKFALWLGIGYGALLALAAGVAALAAAGLAEDDRRALWRILEDRAPLLAFVALLLFFAFAGVLAWFFRNYASAARALAEQTRIVASANPEHRVATTGAPELAELAAAVNLLGDSARHRRLELEAGAAESNSRAEVERDRLAALMSELSEGVLVCNAEGRIHLYNERARALLGAAVGLGRSVFTVIDRDRVAHALDVLQLRMERGDQQPVTTLLATTAQDSLVRVRLAPLRSAGGSTTGMVLALDDVSAAHAAEAGHRSLLDALTTRLRGASANIRAAAETLQSFPDMTGDERARFAAILAQESRRLGTAIEKALQEQRGPPHSGLPLEEMPLADLMDVARERIDAIAGRATVMGPGAEPIWVRVDSFAWTQALASLAARLREDRGIRQFHLSASTHAGFAQLDLEWHGAEDGNAMPGSRAREPVPTGPEDPALTLHELLDRHGAEAWHESDGSSGRFRFLLPLAEPVRPSPRPRPWFESRPEYYDFDLFRNAGKAPGLVERRLADLDFTVFDTETTGLEPSAGDMIISIGAVRIVNGRLLKHETYEQLVDPERPVPKASERIHGIRTSDLAGQPVIRDVLPEFHRYCEGSVLVAHNAAFDLRFLELSGAAAGVNFSQPVLDTLLLSAVAHPHQDDHRLEAIAERLGVPVLGRHTAVGDALVTAEIFLKLVPLLAQCGVHTLGEALEASRETYHARIQY